MNAGVRLHDLLPVGAAVLNVSSRSDADDAGPRADLPVNAVVRIGPGAPEDPSGTLRELLGGDDGWILVRPDGVVAWARTDPQDLVGAVRHALGSS